MKSFPKITFFGPAVLIAVVALASIGLGQVASQPNGPRATTRLSSRRHGPLKIHRWRPDNQLDSENWSGYAVTAPSFTQVMGSWVVPTANCTETPATRSGNVYSSFWVGIDGYTSPTVEQIGTDSDSDYNSDGGSVATYYAWYEFYPAEGYEITSLTVSPGDQISAEVSYSGSEFTVTLTNVTTEESFTKSQRVRKALRSSAEWIAESPCCTRGGGIVPLSDFGTVDFGASYTGVAGTNYASDISRSGPISAFGPTLCTETDSWHCVSQINMVSSSGALLDKSSSLSAAGTSFQVTWVSK
jgi:hypothetical protein